MARFKYTSLIPDDTFFAQQYPEVMAASDQTSKGFELHDPDGNYLNYIEVHGTGLKYKSGYLVSGTITSVEFKTGDGDDYLDITGIGRKIDAKMDLAEISPLDLWFFADKGNDKILGSSGNDVLYSTEGKDVINGYSGDDTLIQGGSAKTVMTGGKGSDTFVFYGSKKMVVTDFDAVGGGANQDYFYIPNTDAKPRIYQDHHDTVLDYGHGVTIRLEDVSRKDFSLVDDVKAPPIFDHG